MVLLRNKTLKFILKLVVSLVFIIWLILSVDWKQVWGVFLQVEILWIFFYIAIFISGVAISSYKWKILANHKEIRLSSYDFFKFYLGGIFVNNFMPSFVGGDTFKAYQIGKISGKFQEAASSVIADRLTGLWGALILTLVFGAFNLPDILSNNILKLVYLVILAAFAVSLLFLVARRMSLWNKLFKFIPQKILDFMSVLNGYADSKILLKAVLFSFLFSLLGLALVNYVIFMAFGVRMNVLDYLSVIFLISIVSSIPVSINNIGIKEWAYVTFFGIFGVGSSVVVAAAILSRFLQLAISFSALPVYLKNKKNIHH